MREPSIHDTPVGRVLGIDARIDRIGPWRPSPEAVRDAVLNGRLIGAHIGIDGLPRDLVQAIVPTQADVERYSERAFQAIGAGRLIDFGNWTNDVIKHGGNRGGPMYMKGVLAHPFRDDYLFMHTWDEGPEHASAVYLVTPLDPGNPAGDCEIAELAPMVIEDERVLALGDRLMLEPGRNTEVIDYRKYQCVSIPAIWRYLPGADDYNGTKPENAAAGNVLDPLMTALLILSTRGIDRITVAASDKLQRARAKNRKPPIPSYDRVHSAPYITAIQAKITRRPKLAGLGGTHASPVPHLRMGHSRTYPDGKVSLVRDALVNFSDEARQAWLKGNRSHYVVKS